MAELVILSGVSGSGKSTALFAFEEMKYNCIENIPLQLCDSMLDIIEQNQEKTYSKTVLSISLVDAREFIIRAKKRKKLKLTVTLLHASKNELLARYKLTRHVHPLQAQGLTLDAALDREIEASDQVREFADLFVDTTGLGIVEFRKLLFTHYRRQKKGLMTVSFVSFGFKHGAPSDADLVFDTRVIPNPYYIDELKRLTGKDKPVADFIEQQPVAQELKKQMYEFLTFYLAKANAESRGYFVVAIGCSGGQHRSVYFAEQLCKHYSASYKTLVHHRDMKRFKNR